MGRVFLESSALLAFLFREEKSSFVADILDSAEKIFASRLLKIESDRAVLRFRLESPEGERLYHSLKSELEEIWANIYCFEITPEVSDEAGSLAPNSRLRALDAIHLATFRRCRRLDQKILMLSLDNRIKDELLEKEMV